MSTVHHSPEIRELPLTRWSMIVAAGRLESPDSREALSRLCDTYWTAMYGYVRRRGYAAEDAHDLTQEFFLRLMERNWIARAEEAKGRFRSFIFTVLKRFLADELDRANTQKRGGDVRLESLSQLAEAGFTPAVSTTINPEAEFEKDWATALLANVLASLEKEYVTGGKAALFAVLKDYLVGGTGARVYADAAAELGMTESAFKVAVCRVRQRYRDRVKAEVAATIANPADVEDEMRHLLTIVSGKY